MNETTSKLLEQLANKLGTTSEYLWSVLLKQAPISSIIDIIQFSMVLIFGYWLYRLHRKLLKKNDDGDSAYSDYAEAAAIPMLIAGFAWCFFFICYFVCFGDIITGLLNPEYWALNKILDSIKSAK